MSHRLKNFKTWNLELVVPSILAAIATIYGCEKASYAFEVSPEAAQAVSHLLIAINFLVVAIFVLIHRLNLISRINQDKLVELPLPKGSGFLRSLVKLLFLKGSSKYPLHDQHRNVFHLLFY